VKSCWNTPWPNAAILLYFIGRSLHSSMVGFLGPFKVGTIICVRPASFAQQCDIFDHPQFFDTEVRTLHVTPRRSGFFVAPFRVFGKPREPESAVSTGEHS